MYFCVLVITIFNSLNGTSVFAVIRSQGEISGPNANSKTKIQPNRSHPLEVEPAARFRIVRV